MSDTTQHHDKTVFLSVDKEWLAEFKKAYARAAETGASRFIFRGHGFVPDYAKYLIEYLEGLA